MRNNGKNRFGKSGKHQNAGREGKLQSFEILEEDTIKQPEMKGKRKKNTLDEQQQQKKKTS